MKNKKTKILMISLLGLLLFVPFTRFSRAQVPPIVGVVQGQHEEWDANIFSSAWAQWDADNMTGFWATAFNQTYLDNMTAVLDTAAKVPLLPQATMFYTVDEIIPDTNGFDENSDGGITADETWADPGVTLVNMSGGTFMDFGGWPYYYNFANGTGIFLANTTAKWMEHLGYGAMYSSLIWATNMFNSGNIGYFNASLHLDMNYTNTIFFAPTNVNWTEFVDLGNTILATQIWNDHFLGIKFSEVPNGFMMSADAGWFGTNSENINVTTTYDANGLLLYHKFEYGSDVLLDMSYADSTYPVVSDASSDFSVPHDYTGVTINWTATDANPGDYAILINGTAEVFPTAWTSGVEIQFAVPDGLLPGDHLVTINFGDTRPNRPNVVSDDVIMTVLPAPVVTPPPDDPTVVIIISSVIGGVVIIAVAAVILMRRRK